MALLGIIGLVAAKLLPDAPPTLSSKFEDLSVPASVELVARAEEGVGPRFFGEQRRSIRVYASHDAPEAVCRALEAAVGDWGKDVIERSGPTGCGFAGWVATDPDTGFAVEVMPIEVYVERGIGEVWDGAAASSFTTVVDMEVRD